MQTFIESAQVFATPAALEPDVEARNNTDRPPKPRNLDLYYGNLHIECYYFCQQCDDHFEIARSLSHKRLLFAVRFLKYHILNQ